MNYVLTLSIAVAALVVALGTGIGVALAAQVLNARDPQRRVEMALARSAALERYRAASSSQAAIFAWFEGAATIDDDTWVVDRERVAHLAQYVREFVKNDGIQLPPEGVQKQ